MGLTTEQLAEAYRRMALARQFEERCAELFQQGAIRGSLHLAIGQEATAAGASLALRDDDVLITNYRGHGHALAKGISPRAAMAEMLGKATGCSKGKGGSMHWTDAAHGLVPANAIVGGGFPMLAGIALAFKLDKTDRVAAAFFGDGSTNQGSFHESMNLASIWKAPAIFLCENNLYSEMTPISQTTPNKDLAERAAAYRIPAEIVDGNDVEAVYDAVCRAVARGRRGEGPSFIEFKTYRLAGHMIGDSQIYRPKSEVEEWRTQRDPIQRARAALIARGVAESALDADVAGAAAIVDDATQFAKDSPYPDLREIYIDVFASPMA